tara:strand:- start:12606 stop:14267 length:1662 start_codon:yes stop_codon:yes gene_type:complete
MDGKNLVRKFDNMNQYALGNWKNLWQECADWCLPTNDNINRVRYGGLEKSPQRMIDTCIEANYNFASGFYSHMFPPNSVWAKYRHPNPMLMADEQVAYYFEQVSRVIHQIIVGSNFAQEQFQALLCMGCFGTNCLTLEEDDKEIVRFRNHIISDVRLEENYLGEVDTVAREFKLTLRQAIQKYGAEALSKAGFDQLEEQSKDYGSRKYTFIQFIMPRTDYVKADKKNTQKPFASFHISREKGTIILESGFDYNPYKVARFSKGNDEIYGRSPMSMILGTARRTNIIYRSMVLSAEQRSNAQWLVPDDDSVSNISNRAGAIIKWRATNPNGKPERLQPAGDSNLAFEMYQVHEKQIKQMFFNHLFRPLEDYRNMTATEVNERMTTDMMTLAPFVSRYLNEHVNPMMEHLYYIAQKKKLLPEVPQALAENPTYEIDYVGRLSMATKSFETMGAINTLRVFGELASRDPNMQMSLQNVEPDKLFREIWYANSSSMNALKDPSKVMEEREAQFAMMQEQMMVKQAPALADAVQKVSGAVDPSSIISQVEQGDINLEQ